MSGPHKLPEDSVPVRHHEIRYGPHPQHIADVWRSDVDPVAVVVFLHGGFWREAHDRHHAAPLMRAVAQAGYVAVNVEYRRVGGAGGTPETFDDIARAVDTLPARVRHVCRLTAETPVVVAGHSAGGHLALWASVRNRLAVSSPWYTPAAVDGVLALAGVCSIEAALADGLGEHAAAQLLSEHDILDRIDPSRIGGGGVPTALVHGELDDRVPARYSVDHERVLTRAGVPARLDLLPEAAHFEVIDPQSHAWPTVLANLAWLRTRGSGQATD